MLPGTPLSHSLLQLQLRQLALPRFRSDFERGESFARRGSAAAPIARIADASGFEDADGNLAVDTAGCMDWNGFAPVTWAGTAPYQTATKTTGLFSFVGISDAIASNDTNYKGGTKQDDTCPDVVSSPTTNKDDLARIYIAGERIGNHPYLFLGWVRAPQNTVNSDLHVAFEFNQSTTPCANSTALCPGRTATC